MSTAAHEQPLEREAPPDATAAGSRTAPTDVARYRQVQASDEFGALRRALRSFVFPATAVFLAWYLLYVLLSAYARGFMGTRLIGNINVAIVFGLLQFVTTFLIAYAYSRYARQKVDPLAERINDDLRGVR